MGDVAEAAFAASGDRIGSSHRQEGNRPASLASRRPPDLRTAEERAEAKRIADAYRQARLEEYRLRNLQMQMKKG